jgi:glycosidase
MARNLYRAFSFFALLALVFSLMVSFAPAAPVRAQVANPVSVTVAGSLQSELGCPGDWQADCAATHLALDGEDDVWQGTWTVPAGGHEYKAALNDSWDENYGANAQPGGANIALNLPADRPVKFFYSHATHWITSNANSVIATVPGSFQSELGCAGDWDPSCLRSWLQDPDGDGTYSFQTTALPAGSYEAKAAINESWDENYGQGGVPGGANLAFTVPAANALVVFTYNPITHVLAILAGHAPDNNVEWVGLRHDSRDALYRAPGGAVPAGTPVLLRFRTFHNDVTDVKVRIFSLEQGQVFLPMEVAASDVSCYEAGLENETCDFWQVALPNASPDNLWYRFIITDGTRTAYYADNTTALDGGVGSPNNDPVDNSYALMAYHPGFTSPSWSKNAVIYQIFPDRFRNGTTKNDPLTGMARYDDPVIKLDWGVLPEGYCRNYADGNLNCPWRFDDTPPDWSPTKEAPRGRDYYGGDLKGVYDKLPYLKALGVNTIYFNPTFEAKSNHRYDTSDFRRIDPNLGTQGEFEKLVTGARKLGIRVVLDGVFNHMSSDSPLFDRYNHYNTVGACESAASPYRGWFTFHDVAPGTGFCVDSQNRPNAATYDGWFGFDSIPVITKSNAEVQEYFLTSPDSISRLWLERGAAGWRMDVMGDSSFPAGYWETFRGVVKGENPEAVIIGELWQKDSTLLRFLRGDRADTTMNYRMRDAVIGLLATQNFDSKGFADSGRPLAISEFAARVLSIREDYPDAAYYSLMNLLDSHDTERLLWTLTPGVETAAEKEQNGANLAAGKQRVRLASLIQFTMPGAPTVYYGDEVGVTGDDDPDDRRTFPWADLGGTMDTALLEHYTALSAARRANPVLVSGDLRVLLADDTARTLAYGRKIASSAALALFNLSDTDQILRVPVVGYLPEGLALEGIYEVSAGSTGSTFMVTGGFVEITLPSLSGALLVNSGADLEPPASPTGLTAAEGAGQVDLTWNAVGGAAGYNVYRSPLSGGGFVKVNDAPLAGTAYTDTGLRNAVTWYYVVTAVDTAGNESQASAEASALPHLSIGWANLQWPPTMDHTISIINRTPTAYGQVWIDGETSKDGATPSLMAQLGFGPRNSSPDGNAAWTWVNAAFNVNAGNNDEFMASMLPEATGEFDYVYRYSTTNGREWLYADLNGPIPAGAVPPNPGRLTVAPSSDTQAPAVPTGLHVLSASPAGISLAWDAVAGDPSLYGYEVLRSDAPGGPFTLLSRTTTAEFTDTTVSQGSTYSYVVRSVDQSFNRSAFSNEVTAVAELRTVTLTFNVTVPDTTDATGRSVYIAGFLDRLDGGHPQWDPGGVVLTRVDATHWTITFTGKETTAIEYKYTLGSWDFVEKDGVCGEVGNRQLTLSYGSTGVQTVNDSVPNWRNVAPCGN